MAVLDEDAPLELLWEELRSSPLWQDVEKMLIEKRDRMVALLVMEEDCKPKRGKDGSITAEDSGMVLARMQRKIGYIEAVNAIVAEPGRRQEEARKARVNA